jgi:indole-3-glycerol phosphate synthase
MSVLAQAAVDLNVLALYGVGLLVIVAILAMGAQFALSFLAQRNLNDLHALGMQAIVASNDIETVDRALDDDRNRVVQNNNGNGDD